MPAKPCQKCGHLYAGHGDVCSACRKGGQSNIHACKACGDFFAGYGTLCGDCQQGADPTGSRAPRAPPASAPAALGAAGKGIRGGGGLPAGRRPRDDEPAPEPAHSGDDRRTNGSAARVDSEAVERLRRWAEQARRTRADEGGREAQGADGAAGGEGVAAGGGRASPDVAREGWRFGSWLSSLHVPDVIAGCIMDYFNAAGDDDLMLTMLRSAPTCGSSAIMAELLRACGVVDALAKAMWDGGSELAIAGAASGKELHDKFLQGKDNFTLAYGNLNVFYGGLEGLIGPPDAKLLAAMKREHCDMPDSTVEFETGNYGITTTSRTEWLFVVSPELGPAQAGLDRWPAEKRFPDGNKEFCRKAVPLGDFQQRVAEYNSLLEESKEPPLQEAEIIGLRLYTGPMFVKYNTLLRGVQSASMKTKYEGLCSGNKYTTTVHVINSALVKLGKVLKATSVYRGISGGMLPEEFWEPNRWNVRGGIEYAFMSTTTNRKVAMEYASGGGKAGTVLEIKMGMVDRGAELSWISQYPHEQEVCFAPLTGLEVLSTRVEKSVLIVEVRLSVNLASLTIEQVVAKRHGMISKMCDEFLTEVGEALAAGGRWTGVRNSLGSRWPKIEKDLRHSVESELASIKQMRPEDMNDNASFIQAVRRAVMTKFKFEVPSHTSVSMCLPNDPALDLETVAWDFTGCDEVTDATVKLVVRKCPALTKLLCSGCTKISDESVLLLAQCRNIQVVDVRGCPNVSHDAVSHLVRNCPKLHTMLWYTESHHSQAMMTLGFDDGPGGPVKVNQFVPMLLKRQYPHLTCVEGFLDALPPDRCDHIEAVDVSTCPFMIEEMLKMLATHCVNLKSARFRGCWAVNGEVVKLFAQKCPRLEIFCVEDCWKVTEEAIKLLVQSCPNLKVLGAASCGCITDESIKLLAKNCQRLQTLDLSNCWRVADPAVRFVARQCPSLQTLRMAGCVKLTDKALNLLVRRCPSLRTLSFRGCWRLTDRGVRLLARHCPHMEEVDLSGCKGISDEPIKMMARQCSRLRSVALSGCTKLTDEAVRMLAQSCRALEKVDCSGCGSITVASLKSLAGSCSGLQYVDFGGCSSASVRPGPTMHLANEAVSLLARNCPNLHTVRLHGWPALFDEAIAVLAEASKELRAVHLGGCRRLTDQALRSLTQCRNLQSVGVSGCPVTEEGVVFLVQNCPALESIDVADCVKFTGDAVVKALAQHCPALRSANFHGLGSLSDEAVKALVEGCPLLQEVDLGACEQLTDEAVRALCRVGQSLKSINFSQNWRVTDAAIRKLAQANPRLQHIWLRSCVGLTDESLKALAEYCPHLQTLDFSVCSEAGDDGVRSCARACANLQTVVVSGCGNVTDAAVKALAQFCPNLQTANFSDCRNLTDEAAKVLGEHSHNLQVVHFDRCPNVSAGAMKVLAQQCPSLALIDGHPVAAAAAAKEGDHKGEDDDDGDHDEEEEEEDDEHEHVNGRAAGRHRNGHAERKPGRVRTAV